MPNVPVSNLGPPKACGSHAFGLEAVNMKKKRVLQVANLRKCMLKASVRTRRPSRKRLCAVNGFGHEWG